MFPYWLVENYMSCDNYLAFENLFSRLYQSLFLRRLVVIKQIRKCKSSHFKTFSTLSKIQSRNLHWMHLWSLQPIAVIYVHKHYASERYFICTISYSNCTLHPCDDIGAHEQIHWYSWAPAGGCKGVHLHPPGIWKWWRHMAFTCEIY